MKWSKIFLNIDEQLAGNDLIAHMIPYIIAFFLFALLLILHSRFKHKYQHLLKEEDKTKKQIQNLQVLMIFFLLLIPLIALLSMRISAIIITLILIGYTLFIGFRMAKFLEIVALLLKKSTPAFNFIYFIYWGLTWPVRLISVSFSLSLLSDHVPISTKYITAISHLAHVLFIFSWAFFLSTMIDALYAYLTCSKRKEVSGLDVTASQGLALTLRFILIILVAVSIFPIFSKESFSALITGLGIGGAAIALASQDVLKNILGGFTIMLDKPFKIGERVQINTTDGIVEEIGFRSTRIRLLNGQLTTIPNQIVATMAINNVTQRPHLRRDISLILAINTPNEKIEALIKILKELFRSNYSTLTAAESPPLICFEDIVENGLLLKIVYRQVDLSYDEYVRISESLNYDIMNILRDLDIKLSQPVRRIKME